MYASSDLNISNVVVSHSYFPFHIIQVVNNVSAEQ